MRPLVFSLLLLSFLLHHAKGIRLEKGFMQVGHEKINEEKSSSILKQDNGAFGNVILCKEGHCTGWNIKLTTVITSTSTISTNSSKNEENGGNKVNSNSKGRWSTNGEVGGEHEKFTVNSSSSSNSVRKEVTEDHYVDIMDYSPARRKPPIHN